MAFRDILRSPNIPGEGAVQMPGGLFYNLDGRVGPDIPQNRGFGPLDRKDDVMLVQYFLRGIATNPQKFNHPFIPPRDVKFMIVDGEFGIITLRWIEEFQVHCANKVGFKTFRDGIVDRAQRGTAISSTSKTVYTIIQMNMAFPKVVGDGKWNTWMKEPDVPGLLAEAVKDPASFL